MTAITDVCEKQAFALGPAVAKFEENVAAYLACKHAIGVSSGTDALIISLMALGVGPGDEVITSPFSFFATAGSVARQGATPVFADIDGDTYNLDPGLIEEKITERTKAILPVHIFGQCAAMKEIRSIAQRHGIAVIEDAAQGIGAEQNGVKCGNFGDLAAFSFYPTKNLGGFGDGGMVTTNDDELAAKLKILRDHGQDPRYFYRIIGGNFRLDGIQGAILDVKLQYLDQWNEKRRANAALYDELLSDSPVKTPVVADGNFCIYHQYTIAAPKRDKLQKHLAENGVGCAVFYPKPLHLQECFAELGYEPASMPVAERAVEEVLSLPVYPELSDEQIRYAADKVVEFYN